MNNINAIIAAAATSEVECDSVTVSGMETMEMEDDADDMYDADAAGMEDQWLDGAMESMMSGGYGD